MSYKTKVTTSLLPFIVIVAQLFVLQPASQTSPLIWLLEYNIAHFKLCLGFGEEEFSRISNINLIIILVEKLFWISQVKIMTEKNLRIQLNCIAQILTAICIVYRTAGIYIVLFWNNNNANVCKCNNVKRDLF